MNLFGAARVVWVKDDNCVLIYSKYKYALQIRQVTGNVTGLFESPAGNIGTEVGIYELPNCRTLTLYVDLRIVFY